MYPMVKWKSNTVCMILLDSIQMVVRLPEDKLQCTLSLVMEWASRKACKRRKMESR